MSVLEFEEKSVEAAIAAACEKLRLPREKLEIEIIAKGSSGIFGIVGARKAKIRVTTKVPAVEAAAERAKEIEEKKRRDEEIFRKAEEERQALAKQQAAAAAAAAVSSFAQTRR